MISGSAIHQRNCCHRRVGVEMIRGRIKDGGTGPGRRKPRAKLIWILFYDIADWKQVDADCRIRFANVLKIRKGSLVIVRWIVDIIFLVNDL